MTAGTATSGKAPPIDTGWRVPLARAAEYASVEDLVVWTRGCADQADRRCSEDTPSGVSNEEWAFVAPSDADARGPLQRKYSLRQDCGCSAFAQILSTGTLDCPPGDG